ncbi:hypothetical protein CEXT_565441 [Caerostris extrusa]|uniref:Uncharacterized protein n=1 Tax=Caerostris extrusa TaxID=172846 RepID=A0AAV4VGR8_CAEEX|nr:hypothetical protein CEXT_565441 [Caerostris extrusa]
MTRKTFNIRSFLHKYLQHIQAQTEHCNNSTLCCENQPRINLRKRLQFLKLGKAFIKICYSRRILLAGPALSYPGGRNTAASDPHSRHPGWREIGEACLKVVKRRQRHRETVQRFLFAICVLSCSPWKGRDLRPVSDAK